jgi:hypothetical protein
MSRTIFDAPITTPASSADRRDGERHQNPLAVLPDAFGFEVLDPRPGLQGRDDVILFSDAVWRDDDRDVAADSFVAGVAEQPLRGRIPGLDDPVQRLADDRVIG